MAESFEDYDRELIQLVENSDQRCAHLFALWCSMRLYDRYAESLHETGIDLSDLARFLRRKNLASRSNGSDSQIRQQLLEFQDQIDHADDHLDEEDFLPSKCLAVLTSLTCTINSLLSNDLAIKRKMCYQCAHLVVEVKSYEADENGHDVSLARMFSNRELAEEKLRQFAFLKSEPNVGFVSDDW